MRKSLFYIAIGFSWCFTALLYNVYGQGTANTASDSVVMDEPTKLEMSVDRINALINNYHGFKEKLRQQSEQINKTHIPPMIPDTSTPIMMDEHQDTETEPYKSADEQREISLALIKLKADQLETLATVIQKSLSALENILSSPQVGPGGLVLDGFTEAQLRQSFSEIRKWNRQITSDIIETSFKTSNEYTEALEKETSMLGHSNADGQSSNLSKHGKKDQSVTEKLVENVISNVEGSVKSLEESMSNENKFSDGKTIGKLETVVKLNNDDDDMDNELSISRDSLNGTEAEEFKETARTIIDSDNNQYVLARSRDLSLHFEDGKLFHDIVYLICLSFLFGLIANMMGLPTFFGYIASGVVLGPSLLNKIQDLVQIETLAQFGVLLILFILGLEFSFTRMKQYLRITVYGGSLMIFIFVLGSMLAGSILFTFPLSFTIFLGLTTSLSSTSVVVKCLSGEQNTSYGRKIFGILVYQDVVLGLILALLPVIGMKSASLVDVVRSVALVLGKTVVFVLCALLIGRVVVKPVNRLMKHQDNVELKILGSLSTCFMFIWASEYFNLSLEVGCFVSGVIISSNTLKGLDKNVIQRIESLRDFFGCLFFAAIGLHIYPSFLYNHGKLLIFMAISVMVSKILVAYIVMRLFFRLQNWKTFTIGVALCQVSEFAFVLASKAKSLGILSKEMYYLLLGVASISILLTPFAWKLLQLLLHPQDRDSATRKLTAKNSNFQINLDADDAETLPFYENVKGRESPASVLKETFNLSSSSGLKDTPTGGRSKTNKSS